MPVDPRLGYLPIDPSRIPGNMPAFPGPGGPLPISRGPTGEPVAPLKPRGQPIVFPWWLYEMPGSQDWNVTANNFTAVANATTDTGASYTVGDGYVGVVSSLILTVQNPIATINLRVRLLLNGAPIPGWSDVYFPPVSATAFVLPINGMVVRMAAKDKLTAVYIEASGTSYTCSFDAKGWVTPVQTVADLMGGVAY